MDGPKALSEARRREAPERRGRWGLGRGAVAVDVQIYAFHAIFALNSTLNLMTSFT